MFDNLSERLQGAFRKLSGKARGSEEVLDESLREVCAEPSPIFADVRGMRASGILTMRYAAGPEAASVTSRLAMLVGSPVSRMLVNVMIGMWKPTYPTRLFTDESEAIAWLLEGSGEAS